MIDPNRYAFAVAVVGDDRVMTPDDLWRLLDLLVNRHQGDRNIVLLSVGRSREATGWAQSRGHFVQFVPECGNPTKQDCELVAHADAVVILGDPGPWRLLAWLAKEAGVPVRNFTGRPRLPPPPPPAWEGAHSSDPRTCDMGKKPPPERPVRRAKGTGSIFYSARRRRWVGRVPLGTDTRGRTVYAERSDPTQKGLIEKLRLAGPPDDTTTVAQWAARWVESLDVRPMTRDAYRHTLDKRIVPTIGHLRMSALTTHHVEGAIREWSKVQQLAPGTIRTTLGQLRTCLGAAVRAGLIAANPATHARKPRPPESKVSPFTPSELVAIIAEAEKRSDTRGIALLAAVGLRVGELTALDVTDVDAECRTVSVTKGHNRKHGIGPPKSPHSVRTVTIPAAAIPSVVAAINGRTAGPLYTSSAAGKRRGRESLRESWFRLLKRLGLRQRNLHQLRHSVATAMISANVPLGDTAKYLGDTVDTIVKTYLHPSGTNPGVTLDRLFGVA